MTVVPIPEPKPDIVPLWIIVLSACAGVIILLLLIYLLYKVGSPSTRPIALKANGFSSFSVVFSSAIDRMHRKNDNHSIETMATMATSICKETFVQQFDVKMCIL